MMVKSLLILVVLVATVATGVSADCSEPGGCCACIPNSWFSRCFSSSCSSGPHFQKKQCYTGGQLCQDMDGNPYSRACSSCPLDDGCCSCPD